MFSDALPVAAGFTRPVVLSSRTANGECQATVGACVVLNSDGWILTAGHLLDIVRQHQASAQRHRGHRDNVVEFQRDAMADKRFRKRGVRTFHNPAAASVHDHSAWWGADDARLVDARALPAADLALGRLAPFDAASVPHYPVIKNPAEHYAPGRSLCKLGFAFHHIVPSYDEKANVFALPRDAVPLPLFPLEGMFTRIVKSRTPGYGGGSGGDGDGETSLFIETSTPTLVGQMGGPLVDAEAKLWGILSHTMHHPLGFKPPVPGSSRGQVEHQFLNTGLAVHASVILAFLDAEGVAYRREA